MKRHNFAAYKPGTFSTDITNFEWEGESFNDKDYPAMVHEYCHYIQDISHISSIMGISMWMIDVAKLTQIFSNGEGKTIKIPLEEKGDSHNRYIRLVCGKTYWRFNLSSSQTL